MAGLDGALALDLEVEAIKNDWVVHGILLDRMDSAMRGGSAIVYRGGSSALPPWAVVRWHRNETGRVAFTSGVYDLTRPSAVEAFRARVH